jgi:hypothetical protein
MLPEPLDLQAALLAERHVCPPGHGRVKVAAVRGNVTVADQDQPGLKFTRMWRFAVERWELRA